jgi:DNA transposition AAA+ family ATPase
MGIQGAVKGDLKAVKPVYDMGLHDRFVSWMEQTGTSLARAAKMINRSTALVHGYIHQTYEGDIAAIEKDIAVLLRREEDLELTLRASRFCSTSASILIWEVMEYCDHRNRMGVVIAESGSGKSETAKEYQRQNRATMIVTANATTRTLGATMRLLTEHVGGRPKTNTIDDMLNKVLNRLKGSRRLLIIDDAHFIPWAGLEVIRKLYDCAGVGVVYLGQEELYNQMTGNSDKARLFDQIYSRVAIKRDRIKVERDDVNMIVESLYPHGFGADEMKYLYQKARGKGHLRNITYILEMLMDIKKTQPEMTDMEALVAADTFLMQEQK